MVLQKKRSGFKLVL